MPETDRDQWRAYDHLDMSKYDGVGGGQTERTDAVLVHYQEVYLVLIRNTK